MAGVVTENVMDLSLFINYLKCNELTLRTNPETWPPLFVILSLDNTV
jgi:hypothetical protein